MSENNNDDTNSSQSMKKTRMLDKYVFDPSDGINRYDAIGILLAPFRIIWFLIKIILFPIFWVFNENKKMYNFIRADSHDTPMNKNEREFFESLPLVFMLTGLTGGVIFGILAAQDVFDEIQKFFANLSFDGLVEFFNGFFGFIGSIFVWLFDAIVFIGKGVASFAVELFQNPVLAFIVIFVIGLLVVILTILFRETGLYDAIKTRVVKLVNRIIGSPELFRQKVNSLYRRFNHRFTSIWVGEERIETRTQVFFKQVTLYTVFLSVWSLLGGIIVAFEFGLDPSSGTVEVIFFFAGVLLASGIVSGLFVLAGIARFLDAVAREKYLAPAENVEGAEVAEAT